MILRGFIFGIVAVVLAGCSSNSGTAVIEEINAARFENQESASVSLITMVNTRSEGGEHSALLINGSEQVLYDPAGTFRHPDIPRSEDMNYGMSQAYVDYYNSYHARFGYYVKVQKLEISREMADALILRAQQEGAVNKLSCTRAASDILNDFAPFSHINTTYFPGRLMKKFGENDAVDTVIIREDDIGQNYN